MYKKNNEVPSVPTANIAVNKSRLKVYNNTGDLPTYYLSAGTEFSIELFNPTSGVILAKIILNGNPISQGGLVINPGQRIFLDRYLDVAKKFLFDTYEVSNTEEVRKAIENNGDFKVEFYRERIIPSHNPLKYNYYGTLSYGNLTNGNGVNFSNTTNTSGIGMTSLYSSSMSQSSVTLDGIFSDTFKSSSAPIKKSKVLSKSIETGRVEQGSTSNQKVVTVDKQFEYWAFHTIEYKMLPISQKINTAEDINVKRYCTQCAHKLSKTDKFCSQCSTKV